METTKLYCVHVAFLMMILLVFFTNYAVYSSNQDDFDVSYYQIHLLIDFANEAVAGNVVATAVSSINNLQKLILNLRRNMTVTAVDGNIAGYLHESDLFSIDIDHSYSTDETISITIQYHGHPSSDNDFNPMTFNHSSGVVTISSESCPYYARSWWRCKNQPDDEPDLTNSFITVPSNLTVATNRILIDVTDNKDGSSTFHWEIRNPGIVYDLKVYYKAEWVINMLRRVLGEEKFWQVPPNFLKTFKYASATTADLKHVSENVADNTLEWH